MTKTEETKIIEFKADKGHIKKFDLFIHDGKKRLRATDLGTRVILSGANGSGKTSLLREIEKEYKMHKANLGKEERKKFWIENFSYYEAEFFDHKNFLQEVINSTGEKIYKDGCVLMGSHKTIFLFLQWLVNDVNQSKRDIFNQKYLSVFLGTKLEKDEKSGQAMLFDKELKAKELSPGQKYLLRICMVLFSKEASGKDISVLLIDEPETHLHTGALIQLMNNLDNLFPEAQIIVSTHSTALLAHWFNKQIFLVLQKPFDKQKNHIKETRSNNSQLLDSLFMSLNSDEEKINQKLAEKNFLAQSYFYAMFKFAFEGLSNPEVCEYVSNDVQLTGLCNYLLTKSGKFNVLDFGAGTGRLLEELNARKNIECEYYAYNLAPINKLDEIRKKKCLTNLEVVYKQSYMKYYIEGIETLKISEVKFDYIVMLNVLHEIQVDLWKDIFNTIKNKLNPHGKLLIIEVDELWIGENSNDNGFMFLSSASVKKLFQYDEIKCETFGNNERKSSLYIIDANKILVSDKSVVDAVETIKIDSFTKAIQIIQTEEVLAIEQHEQFKRGLSFFYNVMQNFNAQRALNIISKE